MPDSASSSTVSNRRAQGGPPDSYLASLGPSFRVGLAAGGIGMLFGATRGLLRSRNPVVSTFASGLDWMVFGTTFTFARRVALPEWRADETITGWDKIKASMWAGAFGGAAIGPLRGIASIIPSIVVLSTVSGAGQGALNLYGNIRPTSVDDLLETDWIPVKRLTDEAYVDVLEEKLLGMHAELAIIDEKIDEARAKIREQEREKETKQPPKKE